MKYSIRAYETIEAKKATIASVCTGAKSSEEVLKTLDRLEVEWCVTEQGDLWVKSWQFAQEDFVSPEEAAFIPSSRPFQQVDELDWLSKNLHNIREQYAGQWIAVYNNEIVAAKPNLPDLISHIGEFDRPLITFISADPVVWTFTYAC